MAKYTIELRRICELYSRPEVEQWFKSYNIEDYLLPDQIEQLNKFNIWSPDRLAKKIVDHFYMREIGFETPGLFKHYALITMEEIMQEKLPLIYTLFLNYDPLINVNYTETFERNAEHNENITGNGKNDTSNNSNTQGTSTSTGNSKSNAHNTASGLNIINDTPQTNINRQNLENGAYASNINQSDTNSTSNQNTDTTNDTTNETTSNDTITSNTSNSQDLTNNTIESYTRNFKGNQGITATYQAMIKQFRENIIAVDKDIINELQTLFMGLY